MSIWSDEEIRILREAYPTGGISGAMVALEMAGYSRSPNAIGMAAVRCGVRMTPEACKRSRSDGQLRRYEEGRYRAEPLSPDRPMTPDSVELVHWYAERGFSARRIAKEINRPVEAIRKALQMRPPAIDREPWWPRRDDMILGRAIA